ncbi:MAG: YdcF family protein [Polyangiaceae bacterium]|nr:YdcF family protein [Polyangiaceae bacterium]
MSRAIVVLGCRVGSMSPETAAGRRVSVAAAAWRPGTWIIASGGRRWDGVAEADAMRAALMALGVPGGSIVRELVSLSTRENAARSAALLRALGVGEVQVATCDWHLPRALRELARAGVRASGLPAKAPVVAPVRAWLRALREWGAG